MRTTFSLLTALVLSVAASAQSDTLHLIESVYFASAAAKTNETELAKLEAFANRLKSYASHTLRVEAFTDEQGTDEYNEDLAQRRALHCTRALAQKNVATTTSSVISHGEQRARQNTASDAERRNDRRVDLVAIVVRWRNTEQAITSLRANQNQRIEKLNPTLPQSVRGRHGGLFKFKPNSLIRADGTPAVGPVTVELTEAYSLPDMLLAGLSTTSESKRLETGGMIKLTATDAEGQALFLREVAAVTASIPTDYFNPNMKIFTGANLTKDGVPTDWVLTEQTVSRPTKATNDSLSFEEYLVRMNKVLSRYANVFLNNGTNGCDLSYEMQNEYCQNYYNWLIKNPAPDTITCIDPATYRVRPKPKLVDTSKIIYQPRGSEKLLMSKKQKVHITAQRRRLAIKIYERRLRSHERSVAYLKLLPKVNAQKRASYEEKLAEWFNKVAKQKSIVIANLTRHDYLLAEARRLAFERRRREREVAQERIAAENKRIAIANEKKLMATKDFTGKETEVQRYVFALNELGWANCDMFIYESNPLPVLARLDYSSDEATVMLLPVGRRSVVPYKRKSNRTWRNRGIPKGLSYHIVAYEVIDGKLVMAHKHVDAASTDIENLEYKPIGITELKDRMRELVGS